MRPGNFHQSDTRLFAEDGREIAPGSDEAGLIAAGGMLVPRGYYKDPEKSAKTFRVVGGKRYAFTGDWGKLAAHGSLILLGRGSNCINTAGEKVFPEERRPGGSSQRGERPDGGAGPRLVMGITPLPR